MDKKAQEEIKAALQKNDHALAVATIKKYLEKAQNTPLNIGITGESGSGKSSFVNAFRGIDDMDEVAAPTGCVETTTQVTKYPHPSYPNVTLWDLPGIGTMKFPASKYLRHVGFEKFDFFIIISDTRFRENDVILAKEIQKMDKKFYFVRSKIDNDLDAVKKSKRGVSEKATLDEIRNNCVKGLQTEGVIKPKVFLVARFDLHLHDFPLLHQTLENELPEHKRDVMLMAMPNISLDVISKKKKAFQDKITTYAWISAGCAAVPIPGLSVAVDLTMLVGVLIQYVKGFGLDGPSLKRLSHTTGVPLADLKAVVTSPLALKEINTALVSKLLLQFSGAMVLMAAEEGLRFIPLIGTAVAATVSYKLTQVALEKFLNELAEDAQRVFRKALGLKTSV